MDVGINRDGKCGQHNLDGRGDDPCRKVGGCGRRLRIKQRDDEQTVDEEGADEVNLFVTAQGHCVSSVAIGPVCEEQKT